MKVLICMRYGTNQAGGAEKSMLRVASLLKKDGHQVRIISLGYKNKKVKKEGLEIEEIYFRPTIIAPPGILRELEKYYKVANQKLLAREIIGYKPDLVLTQHEISFLIMKLKLERKLTAPTIYFIHGREYFNKVNLNKIKKAIRCFEAIVFPSIYLKKIYENEIRTSKFLVINPFFKIKNIPKKRSRKREYILHIKPTKEKGILTTLWLAEKLPKEKFLIVGKLKNNKIKKMILKLKNTTYLGYVENMEEVYLKSKFLIVPTIKPETFSISSIEAQSMGCRVLTTNKGGMVIPQGSIIRNPKNIREWELKLKTNKKIISKNKIKDLDEKKQHKILKRLIESIKNERIQKKNKRAGSDNETNDSSRS